MRTQRAIDRDRDDHMIMMHANVIFTIATTSILVLCVCVCVHAHARVHAFTCTYAYACTYTRACTWHDIMIMIDRDLI